jgi:hypothetical protein
VRGRGSAKIRSTVVATIRTREDFTRVMASTTVVEGTRHLAREVGEEEFAKNLQSGATNVGPAPFLRPCMLGVMDWLLKRQILV